MERISLTKIVIVIILTALLILAAVFYYYYHLSIQPQQDTVPDLIFLENGEPDPNQRGFVEGNLSPEAYQEFKNFIEAQSSTTVNKKITPASEE